MIKKNQNIVEVLWINKECYDLAFYYNKSLEKKKDQ